MQRLVARPFVVVLCLAAGCRSRAPEAQPPGERPLLSYLTIGTKRVAFGPDTVVESGRRSILVPTSFDGASRIIGPSAVGNKGDGGEVLRWMCYRLAGEPNMSLVLEADETSGGHLGGFELFPVDSRPELESECIALNVPPSQIATNTGLHLGMTRDEVSAKLGVEGQDSAGVVIFRRVVERSAKLNNDEQRATLTATFTVWFQDDRVARFSGWRVDSN